MSKQHPHSGQNCFSDENTPFLNYMDNLIFTESFPQTKITSFHFFFFFFSWYLISCIIFFFSWRQKSSMEIHCYSFEVMSLSTTLMLSSMFPLFIAPSLRNKPAFLAANLPAGWHRFLSTVWCWAGCLQWLFLNYSAENSYLLLLEARSMRVLKLNCT